MKRVKNFSPGPATLPLVVLEQARDELVDYLGSGKSILETSHRAPDYEKVHDGAMKLLLELLGLGSDYKVGFFGGGASTQFALVPMNLLHAGETADYLVTGAWSKKALEEAQRVGNAHVAFDPTAGGGKFTRVPKTTDCHFSARPVYVHLTSNNTIAGTQYHAFPEAPGPLVADMSSDFLWAPFDAQRFGLLYAGAQKNVGPAGVTVVVMRQDLIERCKDNLPAMFDYKLQLKERSLYNTPPVFGVYLLEKTLAWIKAEGGLPAMRRRNLAKAELLYRTIDGASGFYRSPVEEASRSTMNVVFRLPSEELEKKFIAEAKAQDMIQLTGHRSVGGVRASIYNAAELSWVEALTDLMKDFAQRNG